MTGSSTEPDTSNYVMVRETLALRRALRAAKANISADDTMDDIIEPGHDAIPIAQCRELLGDEALGTSEADVDAIRRHAHAMAHVLIEIFLSDPPRA